MTTTMTIDATRISTPHEVRDSAKLAGLVESMRHEGWVGRPVLALSDPSQGLRALTGSHRIAAARVAGVAVPALVIEQEDLPAGYELDLALGCGLIVDGEAINDQNDMLAAIESIDAEAADLMRQDMSLEIR